VSHDEVRQLADDIVARPEFQQPPENWLVRARDWVLERVGDLLSAATGGGAGSIVGIIVLIALVGLVAWLLIRVGRTVQADRQVAAMTIEGVHRRSPAAWRAEAETLEAEGRWKEALRCRYRALVGDLVAERLLEDVAGRTTGELRSDLSASAPDRYDAFDAASELFELAWYADRATGPEESARFQALAASITGVRA
jgi:hypothetical protein